MIFLIILILTTHLKKILYENNSLFKFLLKALFYFQTIILFTILLWYIITILGIKKFIFLYYFLIMSNLFNLIYYYLCIFIVINNK